MPIIFRGMRAEEDDPDAPRQGTAFGNTQARVPQDVQTYEEAEEPWVAPMHEGHLQGLSVVTGNGCNLPPNNRPKNTNWDGTASSTMHVWTVDTANLGEHLAYHDNPLDGDDPWETHHGLISPQEAMTLVQYQTALAAVPWTLVAPPAEKCGGGATATAKDDVMGSEDLEARVLEAAVPGQPDGDALAQAVIEANAGGMTRDEILAALTGMAQRLEDAGDQARADEIWTLVDQVSGFVSAHSRLNLK